MMEKLSSNQAESEGLKQRCRDLEENLKIVRERMAQAAVRSGRRPEDITLLAATKTVPVEVINYGVSLGLHTVGENKVQELCEKYDRLDLQHSHRHFIGHLQTNKVKQLIGKVEMIQSVDSVKLAKEISRLCLREQARMDVLVEVNIGGEENKSGVNPQALPELLEEIRGIPAISVRGLMTIPPVSQNVEETKRYFSNMYKIFIDIKAKKLDNMNMEFLSMGMSADYAEAIEMGANLVRVGSALFGARIYA